MWFANLHNLRELSIQYNGIKEIPKDTFANLRNLEAIWLSNNNLTFINSNSFGPMRNLTELYLKNNQIVSFDEEIIDNHNLLVLDLEGNVCSNSTADNISNDKMKEMFKNCFV
jgi:insulin-like growth factor-binding protein complex acid labile subunit